MPALQEEPPDSREADSPLGLQTGSCAHGCATRGSDKFHGRRHHGRQPLELVLPPWTDELNLASLGIHRCLLYLPELLLIHCLQLMGLMDKKMWILGQVTMGTEKRKQRKQIKNGWAADPMYPHGTFVMVCMTVFFISFACRRASFSSRAYFRMKLFQTNGNKEPEPLRAC